MKLYHYSPRVNRASIMAEGLRPATYGTGGDSDAVWLDERGPEDRGPDTDCWMVAALGPYALTSEPGELGEPWWRTTWVLPTQLRRVPNPLTNDRPGS